MSTGTERPAIVTWQHRYCALMAVMYLVCIGLGVLMIVFRNEAADADQPAVELLVSGIVLIAVGVVLSLVYGVAPFLRTAPWLWTFHLVLIALGLTSLCCLPICIPLLIGWIKPETRQYFGKS
jgi:cell division protein FtsW (lipid II flippase)